MAPFGLSRLAYGPRRVRTLVLVVMAALLIAGCSSGDIDATWQLEPIEPVLHRETIARLVLTGPEGAPIRGARVRFEGHMSHPGMAPVVADASEGPGGVYEARLSLTMAGEWSLVADAALPDGRRITRTLAVTARTR